MCIKYNYFVNYVWNNKHINRSYPILVTVPNVKIITNEEYLFNEIKLDCNFTQKEILKAAVKISPKFNIYFNGNVKPVGIHLRGGDRIGINHSHFMKNIYEYNLYLSKTIELINISNPNHVFICSDDEKVKKKFIKYLNKNIKIIKPNYNKNENIPIEYIDFFALTLCEKIYMSSKFSTFSLMASIIGNIPIVSYNFDESVKNRYKANFEYEKTLREAKYIEICSNKDFN